MLELFLAILYVLCTYLFMCLLLYSMHLESPPETVDTPLEQQEQSNEKQSISSIRK